jgi:ribosomal protein S27AE
MGNQLSYSTQQMALGKQGEKMEIKICPRCGASMQGRTSFFGGMAAIEYRCFRCGRESIIAEYPENLELKLVRRKMGYTKHFEERMGL